MPTPRKKTKKRSAPPASTKLKGWEPIAKFLGQPVNGAQRWGKPGMPMSRQGRIVIANPDELNRWLGREAGVKPLHVATTGDDLAAELKRGLAYVKESRSSSPSEARGTSTHISTKHKRVR